MTPADPDSTFYIVFADDWGRHPSSCQHLFRQILPRHRTFWVNTIGMRKPGFNLDTLRRGLEKIRHWTRGGPKPTTDPLPENLTVTNPRMWPSFATRFSRRLNRWLLARHLRRLARTVTGTPTVVTTIPVVAELIRSFPEWRWAYYCVDDFGVWPGVDQRTMQRMERQLVAECHRVVAVSETLQTKLRVMGRESLLLTHGVDLDFWRGDKDDPALPELEGIERPLIVFWGVTDRRMDVPWIQLLGERLQQGTVLLVGPLADPDPNLLTAPRVRHVPPLPFDRLPVLAREASVLIMPYADLPVTRAMQPLKLKEYLATGKPTVVRDLPANREWADCMDVVADKEAFVETVERRLREGLPQQQLDARSRLEAESWQGKARVLEEWVTMRDQR